MASLQTYTKAIRTYFRMFYFAVRKKIVCMINLIFTTIIFICFIYRLMFRILTDIQNSGFKKAMDGTIRLIAFRRGSILFGDSESL